MKLKRYNVILIASLVALMLLLGILMIFQMFGYSGDYKVVSRKENIEKSKKSDGKDFETIGWVRVQGTNIDYPLYGLLSTGYDYPVTKSYLWSLNLDSEFHSTMLVYGHNVMNLGAPPEAHGDDFVRMEELMNFVYYDFAKENQFIQLSIDGKDYLYQVFAVNFMYYKDLDNYPHGNWSQTATNSYIERIMEETIYDFSTKYKKDDKILSVVTCSRFFGDGKSYDLIVTGRLVGDEEPVKLAKVYRNKNYEKIAERLKGADENEE
ncbi:MAG: class B sortase [Bacilli bacterium]|nr:class B sortase [Bacilli bacterium]